VNRSGPASARALIAGEPRSLGIFGNGVELKKKKRSGKREGRAREISACLDTVIHRGEDGGLWVRVPLALWGPAAF